MKGSRKERKIARHFGRRENRKGKLTLMCFNLGGGWRGVKFFLRGRRGEALAKCSLNLQKSGSLVGDRGDRGRLGCALARALGDPIGGKIKQNLRIRGGGEKGGGIVLTVVGKGERIRQALKA